MSAEEKIRKLEIMVQQYRSLATWLKSLGHVDSVRYIEKCIEDMEEILGD